MTRTINNINDGTTAPPRLGRDLTISTTWLLPEWSAGPSGDPRAVHEAIATAGFDRVQGGDPDLCRELDLGVSTFGLVHNPGTIAGEARKWADQGFDCSTLHVGSGMETDDRAHALIDEIIQASVDHDIPLYIETHRATVTQDIRRTVDFVDRFPEMRFNGDFSHWYTGLEMTYGNFEAKLDFLAPVLERTRYIHGRIGDPGCIQIDIGADGSHPSVAHFRDFWTRAMAGFLATADPGDVLPFAPELLPSEINYARTAVGPDGEPREEVDRWKQAILLADIAEDCFTAAQTQVAAE